jgi:hypothetical protein
MQFRFSAIGGQSHNGGTYCSRFFEPLSRTWIERRSEEEVVDGSKSYWRERLGEQWKNELPDIAIIH